MAVEVAVVVAAAVVVEEAVVAAAAVARREARAFANQMANAPTATGAEV